LQPNEPRPVDPDLLIEIPREPVAPERRGRRLRLNDDEKVALAELLSLAIAWNPVLRSSRIEQWKAILAKIEPASRTPENAPSAPTEADPTFLWTVERRP
jgi:hypothetical protein